MPDNANPQNGGQGTLPVDHTDPYTDPYEDEETYHEETGEGEPPAEVVAAPKTPQELEEAYLKRQDRTLHQKVDFLLPQVVTMIEDERVLDLAPKYQRRFRWKRKKQSLLIESFLLNVPMPSVFLYEIDLAKYEVMDGRQRLSTIHDYLKGKFKLQGLTELAYLNGKGYDDLPSKIKASLRRASLPVTIILTESRKDDAAAISLRQLVFERLNTGGQILNPQEVRNCIYDGAFNDMLVRVARSALFTTIWGIPPQEADELENPSDNLKRNRLFSTMEDCAIVLRYFAFMDVEAYTVPKKRLDNHMKDQQNCSKESALEMEADYLESLELASSIYGEATFRVYPHLINPANPHEMGLMSVPLSDAVLLACKAHRASKDQLIANKAAIVEDTRELMKDRAKYDALIGSKNTKDEFRKRIQLISDIMASHA